MARRTMTGSPLTTMSLIGSALMTGMPWAALAGDPDFDIRGRLHMDYHLAAEDEEDYVDGWNNRRARLGMSGSVSEHWSGQVEVNVPEGDISPAAFYLRRDLGAGSLTLGQVKVPQGMNQLTNSNALPLMERSAVNNIVPDGFRIGVTYEQLGEKAGLQVMHFGRALGDVEGEDKDYSGDQPQGLGARAIYAPFLGDARDEAAPRLHLGASLVYEEQDEPHTMSFSDRPELRGGDGGTKLIGVDVDDVEDTTKGGLELAYIDGPISAEAEYLAMAINQDNGDDPTFDGYHVQGAYTLTGESRTYSTGGFGGVSPSSPSGVWEVAGRYSHMDLNDGGIQGGEQSAVTLGVNYYPASTIRFMGNVVFADVKDRGGEPDTSPTLFGFRIQHSW